MIIHKLLHHCSLYWVLSTWQVAQPWHFIIWYINIRKANFNQYSRIISLHNFTSMCIWLFILNVHRVLLTWLNSSSMIVQHQLCEIIDGWIINLEQLTISENWCKHRVCLTIAGSSNMIFYDLLHEFYLLKFF